jgi:V/A-type H+/Na+-transporting ATPase subunit A
VVRAHFTKLTGLFRNYNDAAPDSQEARRLKDEINALDESAPMTARSA